MPEQRLTFVHISDTHISPDMEYGKHHAPYSTQTGARALVRAVNALPFNVDFILHTGDVVYDPVPEAYLTAKDILSELARATTIKRMRCKVFFLDALTSLSLSITPSTLTAFK